MRAVIKSFGHYVPNRVVTNSDMTKFMDTSDEWIQQRSGIKERRWITPGKESTLSMATEAARDALKKAKLKADDIDAIIFGALVTDYVFPGTGCLLQESLGCKKPIPALDLRNQCSAFLYSLSIADAWIRAGVYKKILIVASEIHSTSLDLTTRGREISVLFGDGAGACVVEASESSDRGILDIIIASEGKNADKLFLPGPSSNDSPRVSIEKAADYAKIYPSMDGKFVFKNAVTRMTEVITEITKKNNVSIGDIDFVVAHQANARINSMVLQQLGIPETKTHNTLEKFGNTTAATIPITMNEAIDLKKVKRGDLVALVAFGSGFTWGSALVQF